MGWRKPLFAAGFLECLKARSRAEFESCIYRADLGVFRALMYQGVVALAAASGCRGPYTVSIIDYDTVRALLEGCGDAERAAWTLAELLERLPGVAAVKTRVGSPGEGVVEATTIPWPQIRDTLM